MVKILTSSRFRKLFSKLSPRKRAKVNRILDDLSAGFALPHAHQGLGIRKLADALFEVRIGLDLRIVFWFEDGEIILHFIGNHTTCARS